MVIAIVALGGLRAAAATLTGLIVFSTNSGGDFFGAQVWNTLGGDDPFNLYAAIGLPPPGLSAPIINPGNGPTTSISIPLTLGIHNFTLFGNPGSEVAHFGINLFFDGNNTNPGISAFAPMDTPPSPPFPAFSANFSPSTPALNFFTIVPGAGTLTFTDGIVDVTLTVFSWSNPPVFNVDRVQPYDSVPGAGNDFVGRLVLEVTPSRQVPEPSTGLLVLSGVIALGARQKLRRSSAA